MAPLNLEIRCNSYLIAAAKAASLGLHLSEWRWAPHHSIYPDIEVINLDHPEDATSSNHGHVTRLESAAKAVEALTIQEPRGPFDRGYNNGIQDAASEIRNTAGRTESSG